MSFDYRRLIKIAIKKKNALDRLRRQRIINNPMKTNLTFVMFYVYRYNKIVKIVFLNVSSHGLWLQPVEHHMMWFLKINVFSPTALKIRA